MKKTTATPATKPPIGEQWLPVSGWPYEVSNTGRVRNTRTGHILTATIHKTGYKNVQLWSAGKFKTFMEHRLVAFAFIGDPPTSDHEVAHSDGDKTNNKAENLRWVLHTENMADREKHGMTARGEKNGKLKHTDETVQKIRDMKAGGLGSRRIASQLGISRGTVAGYINNSRRQQMAVGL